MLQIRSVDSRGEGRVPYSDASHLRFNISFEDEPLSIWPISFKPLRRMWSIEVERERERAPSLLCLPLSICLVFLHDRAVKLSEFKTHPVLLSLLLLPESWSLIPILLSLPSFLSTLLLLPSSSILLSLISFEMLSHRIAQQRHRWSGRNNSRCELSNQLCS